MQVRIWGLGFRLAPCLDLGWTHFAVKSELRWCQHMLLTAFDQLSAHHLCVQMSRRL